MGFYLVKSVNGNVEVELLEGFSDYRTCYNAMKEKGFDSFDIVETDSKDRYLKIYMYKYKDQLEVECVETCNTLAFRVYNETNYLYNIKTTKLIPFKKSFWDSRHDFVEVGTTSDLLELVSLRTTELMEEKNISDKDLKELDDFAKENNIPFSAEFIKSFVKTLNEKHPALMYFWNSSSAYC